MTIYNCTDGYADIEIEADSAEEGAREYVAGGDWRAEGDGTTWVTVTVTDEDGDDSSYTITVDPDEPPCVDGEAHDWQSPLEVVGGIDENPGVWGHGGGVIMTEVCRHCGRYQVIDTWAQNPEGGEQGLTSTVYRDADEESLAWIHQEAE